MLGQLNLWGKNKVEVAIDRLQSFEPNEGYYLNFSGGKDSQCIYELAKIAGVKFDAHYRVTGIDPPELVRFIKNEYPDVEFDIPRYPDGRRITMWSLIEHNTMPPTRKVRYCCESLKESAGDGRLNVTGVRWAESTKRKETQGEVVVFKKGRNKELSQSSDFLSTKNGGLILVNDNNDSRRLMEQCLSRGKIVLNPIIDWEEDDVWEFLNEWTKVPHCSLYDEGFKRLGCIGCPLSSVSQKRDFDRWPKYKELYIKAFERMIDAHRDIPDTYALIKITKDGATTRQKAELLYEWWTKEL